MLEAIDLDRRIEVAKLEMDLMEYCRTDSKAFEKSFAIAYFVLQLKKKNEFNYIEKSVKELCSDISNQQVRNFIYEMMNGVEKSFIDRLLGYDEEVLADYIISVEDRYTERGQESTTPKSLCRLAAKILDIKEGESVVDNCMGLGTFIATASEFQHSANYYGVEINASIAAITYIKLSILATNFNIVSGNALEENFDGKKFDKGFSNYPFGMRIRTATDCAGLIDRINKNCPELSKGTSADWIFNYRLCEMLTAGGMGIAIMSLGGLWNTLDKPIRETFVKYGKIKAIVKLPARLYANTAIPVALVVFGNNNGGIRFVDASQEYVEGRRQNTLDEKNIENIIKALNEDSSISRLVSIEEIADNQFSFDPTRYNEVIEEIVNGVPFETIIKSITRGAPLTAKDLDDISSVVPTDCQYMMLANIKNGIVDKELPYIKEIPSRLEKYCIHKGDLLLSKNGYPFKVAVAEPADNKTILANGNLYVIELDTEKVDPYYVKAFLESDSGVAQLKRITVGATIPNIGVAQLNTILIPLIPIEEQRKVSLQYQAVLDEIELLKRKIEKAENSLKTIFNSQIREENDG